MGLPKTKPDLPIEDDFDDEAATVVIDLNKLKEEFNSAPKVDLDTAIEFNAHSTSAGVKSPLSIDNVDSVINDDNDKTEVFSADMGLSLVEEIEAIDDEVPSLESTQEIKIKTILFDLKGSELKEMHSSQASEDHRFDFQTISNLGELNKLIKLKEEMIVVFYYNQNPKAINTLMNQMNSKFKHIKTMIIAKNLSDQKAQMHKKTASGAHVYLSTPQSFQEVIDKLKTLS